MYLIITNNKSDMRHSSHITREACKRRLVEYFLDSIKNCTNDETSILIFETYIDYDNEVETLKQELIYFHKGNYIDVYGTLYCESEFPWITFCFEEAYSIFKKEGHRR